METEANRTNKLLFWLSLLLGSLIIGYIIAINKGTFATGDGITHYFISRYSWLHSRLFFDIWGKPFFTLLSSPFAQLGFEGIIIFNLILYISVSILLKSIFDIIFTKADKYSFFIPIFLLSAPIYLNNILGSYTSVLFSFLVILSLFLFLKKKYIFSAIIISILPFSRPEFIIFMPLFFILFIYKKKFYQILFFFTAFIIYSFLGSFYYHDLFWFINLHPYKNTASFYGHGSLFHFVKNYKNLFGLLETIFIILGLFIISIKIFKKKNWKDHYYAEIFLIVVGGFLGVLTVHSYLWYTGTHSSLGLLRVIATVIPLTIIIIGVLFEEILKKFTVPRKYIFYFISCLLIFQLITIFQKPYFPIKYSKEANLILKATNWIKSSNLKYNRIIYSYPLVGKEMNIDVFDRNKAVAMSSINKKNLGSDLFNNDLIVWDSHFGQNDDRLPFDKIFLNRRFEYLKSFFPEKKMKTLGGNNFVIFIFKYNKNYHSETDSFNIFKKKIFN